MTTTGSKNPPTHTARTRRAKRRPRESQEHLHETVNPPLDERGAAKYLGVSHGSLRGWRAKDAREGTQTAPVFYLAGKQVRYRKVDLDNWISERLSRPGDGAVMSGQQFYRPTSQRDEPSSGWDTHGNEFTIKDELPYQTRWRSLRGSAKEKLAAFDSELASQLEQRKITLPTAKSILLQRDVDAAAKRQVAELEKATPPYLGLVLRSMAGSIRLKHVVACLMLKCTCGAMRERLSYFAHEDTYRVVCPKCHTGFTFEDAERKGRFIFSGACVPADIAALLTCQCDVPIRELAT